MIFTTLSVKPSLVVGVLEEAEFYNITSLIKLIKDKIRERDCKTSQVCEAPVYVLQSGTVALVTIIVTITRHYNKCHWFPSSGPSQACVPGAAVPGGGADADGVHHVWRLEVRASESCRQRTRQRSSFHVLHPSCYASHWPRKSNLQFLEMALRGGEGERGVGKLEQQIPFFVTSAYMIRASFLCSDWLLQLVSIGYGRARQSEFLLIVSREVKGEESTLPNNSGEVCPTNLCPRAGHCMVPILSTHNLPAIVCP